MDDQVFRDPAEKQEDAWRVIYRDRIQRPSFNSKGAALAFLSGLQKGSRKEEA